MSRNNLELLQLTPVGRGAIAALQLTGPTAKATIQNVWVGPNLDFPADTLRTKPIFGRIRLNGINAMEEIVLHQTESDSFEIFCHGGTAVLDALKETFQADAEQTEPIENEPQCQKEKALAMLIQAKTQRSAMILLDQYNGALEREWEFIDKISDPIEKQRQIGRLAQNAKLARHLIEPFRVALLGSANAGKSSLFNAILGFQRTIVDPTPGTTRDSIEATTALEGFPFLFCDTAGFRPDAEMEESSRYIETEGIHRSMQYLDSADLILWVVDASSPMERNATFETDIPILTCMNKIDLIDQPTWPNDYCSVSAVTGQGIDHLLDRIVQTLIPRIPQPLEGMDLNFN